MVAPRTTWLVRPHEDAEPRPGELRLEPGARALVFEAEAGGTFTVSLEEIDRVRRLRGSPVLEVRFVREGARRLAFHYFTEPPPMGASLRLRPDRRQEGRVGRVRAFALLRGQAIGVRAQIEEWVSAIREAAETG